MLRDPYLIHELAKQLNQSHYINYDSDEVLTDSQAERINEYIDDLSIDLFFRLAPIKPIQITPQQHGFRFTPYGVQKIDKEYTLNLRSPYDRYTFLSILTHPDFFDKSQNNNFLCCLFVKMKKFGASGISSIFTHLFPNPYVDAFSRKPNIFGPDHNRAAMLYGLKEFIRDASMGLNLNPYFLDFMSDYASIKNQEVFPEITLEYALSLYVILVEKLKLSESNISPIVAYGLEDSKLDPTSPLTLFHNFELRLKNLFRKEEIEINDLFLRFVNSESSKAFSFTYDTPDRDYVNIQLFQEQSVHSVRLYNTLPLPYLHDKLYR